MKRAILNTTMMMLAAPAGLLIASGSQAKTAGYASPARYNNEIRMDKDGIADDIADLDRLSDLVMEWNYLRRSGARERDIRAAFARITRELRSDLGETNAQARHARAEIRRSARELGDYRRGSLGEFGDYVDDMRDEKQAREIVARKREIIRELVSVQKRIDRTNGNERWLGSRQLSLLEEYLKLSGREIAMGYRELREDRREFSEARYYAGYDGRVYRR